MAKFIVLATKHIHYGQTYTEGDEIESDLPLDRIFRGKFGRVTPKKKKKIVKRNPDEDEDEEEVEEEQFPEEEKALGENVTERFPAAKRKDMLVFKSKRGYFVASPDHPSKAVHDGPIKDKLELDKFLAENWDQDEKENETVDDDDGQEPSTVHVRKKKSKNKKNRFKNKDKE